MKKHSFGKAISVVTSLVLVISILLSMSLTALATTTEIYGTEAGGIENTDVRTLATVDGTANHNLDFSKGLQYWGFAAGGRSITSYATLKTIDGTNNQYVEFNKSVYDFATVPFSVEAAKDEKIGIAFDYIGTGNFSLELWQVASDGNKYKCGVSQTGSKFAAGESVNNGWDTYFTSYIQNAVVADGTEDGKATFYAKINFELEAGQTAAVDNFRVLKQTGGDEFTVLDTNEKYNSSGKPATGSVAEGIVNKDVRTVAVTEGIANPDFARGLKYWGFANTYSGSALSYATLKTIDGTNNQYVEFNKSVYDFATVPFSIDADEGDYIGVLCDFTGTGSASLELWQVTSEGNKFKCGSAPGEANALKLVSGEATNSGWTAYFTRTQTAVVADGTDDGKATFYIKINFTTTDGQTAAVDNFRLIKQNADSSFTTLDTNEFYSAAGVPACGTFDEGIKSKADTLVNMPVLDELTNGDFTEGLKYWGGIETNTPASIATIKNENGNNYVNIKTSKDDPAWYGIASVPFKISGVKAGDYVGIRLKYRTNTGSATGIFFSLAQNGYQYGNSIACNEGPNSPSVSTTNGEWNYLMTDKQGKHTGGSLIAVSEPANGEDIWFMVRINTWGSTLDIDIDDIEIIKIDNVNGNFCTSIDGKPYGYEMGDANADGIVDILDLVRLKKYLADSSTSIYKAAVNYEENGINSVGLTYLCKQLLEDTCIENCSIDGKHFVFLGSSVTYGSASGGWSMADYIRENHDCTVTKLAVSGTTLTPKDDTSRVSYLNRFVDAIADEESELNKNGKVDHLMVQLSMNDLNFFYNINNEYPPATYPEENKNAQLAFLGTINSNQTTGFDTDTLSGAIEYIYTYAKERLNCEVSFYTCHKKGGNNYYKQMVDTLLAVQKKWQNRGESFGVLDIYNDLTMNHISDENFARFMATLPDGSVDGQHPNLTGYRVWFGPKFEKYFQQYS